MKIFSRKRLIAINILWILIILSGCGRSIDYQGTSETIEIESSIIEDISEIDMPDKEINDNDTTEEVNLGKRDRFKFCVNVKNWYKIYE